MIPVLLSNWYRYDSVADLGGFPGFHGTPLLVLVATENLYKSKTNYQVQQIVVTNQNIKNNAYITLYTYSC